MMTPWPTAIPPLLLADQNGVGGLARAIQDATPLLPWILAALGAGVVMVVATRWVQAAVDRLKEAPFVVALLDSMGFMPGAAGDPAARARLDDLRRRFSEGVDTFHRAGKDLGSLPWYLLVGPPGAGKTEAIRRSKLSFPPGLHDYYQGAGGTLNMHWWFTNHAVVLDTAGRIFMEQPAARTHSEWRSFLALLRRHRPRAPINGIILVLGADTLLAGRDEEIEANANQIARQVQTISTELGVRAPVYLLLTKCDLIPGFAPFFDGLDDAAQQQMLGWSNDKPLDQPFHGELIEEAMREIRDRVAQRRLTLLASPRHAAPRAQPEPQLDELYALPHTIAQIAAPLRRSLEIIFQHGPWSPRPPFLRGVYLTSSMRKGQTLDRELALALGAPIGQIPGGKVWAVERSMFLRDVFERKIFVEKGLVTSAAETPRRASVRRRGLIGLAAAFALVSLVVASIVSNRDRQSLSEPGAFWSDVRDNILNGRTAIVTGFSRPVFAGQERDARVLGNTVTRSDLLALVRDRSSPTDVPDALRSKVRRAAESYIIHALLVPTIEQARARLAVESTPTPASARALARLLALDVRASGLAPADGPSADLTPVFEALFEGQPDGPTREQTDRLVAIAADIGPAALAAAGAVATDASRAQLESAIDQQAAAWRSKSQPDRMDHARSIAAIERLRQFAQRHGEVGRRLDAVASGEDFVSQASKYAEEVALLEAWVAAWPAETLSLARDAIETPPDAREIVEHVRRTLAAEHDALRGTLPTAGGQYAAMADTLREAFTDAVDSFEARAHEAVSAIKEPRVRALAERARGARAASGVDAVLTAHRVTAEAIRRSLAAADDPDPASWRAATNRYAALDQAWLEAREAWAHMSYAASPADDEDARLLTQRLSSAALSAVAAADLARLRVEGGSAGGEDAAWTKWERDIPSIAIPFESREERPLSESARAVLEVLARLDPSKRPPDLLEWARGAADAMVDQSPCFDQSARPWRNWDQFRRRWADERVVPASLNATLAQRLDSRAAEADLFARVLDDPWLAAWAAECRERAHVARAAAEPGSRGAVLLATFTDRLAQLASMTSEQARRTVIQWASFNTFDAEFAAPFDPSVPDYWRHLARSCLGALSDGDQEPGPEIAELEATLGPPITRSGTGVKDDRLVFVAEAIESITIPPAEVTTRIAPLAGPLARLAAGKPLGLRAELLDGARAAANAARRSPFAVIGPLFVADGPTRPQVRVAPATLPAHAARARVELIERGIVVDVIDLPPMSEVLLDRRVIPAGPLAGFARTFIFVVRFPKDGRAVLLRVELPADWPFTGSDP
jgi:DNA polymerase III delta prime subunit